MKKWMALLCLFGCSGANGDYVTGASSSGLGAKSNQAKCATCHSQDGTAANFSGSTFKDIAYHSAYKGGDAKTTLDAANACVTGWMGGTALKDGDPAWTSMQSYLKSISDPSKTAPNPLAPEVLADVNAYDAAYQGGNASAGAAKYTAVCGKCHDSGLVIGSVAALSKAALKNFSVGRIAQQVRTSGPPPSGTNDKTDSTPGPMPFFQPSFLSAQDLKDIIAYVRQ